MLFTNRQTDRQTNKKRYQNITSGSFCQGGNNHTEKKTVTVQAMTEVVFFNAPKTAQVARPILNSIG